MVGALSTNKVTKPKRGLYITQTYRTVTMPSIAFTQSLDGMKATVGKKAQRHTFSQSGVEAAPCELQSHFGLFGPEFPKESEKSLPRPSGPKSFQNKSTADLWLNFELFSGSFFGLWTSCSRKALGDSFSTFWVFGLKGPKWLCSLKGLSGIALNPCPTAENTLPAPTIARVSFGFVSRIGM